MSDEPSAPNPQPARVLGPIDATCIVIGAIIGVGIFFNPTGVARLVDSGAWALLAWSLAGFIALCGALTFAELGGWYTGNGAQYEVLRDAYGPLPAFLYVFCNATAIQAAAIGVIALICVQYLCAALGRGAPSPPVALGGAIALVVGLSTANILGVKWGSRIQVVTVAAKVLTLLAVTAIALFAPVSEAGPVAPGRVGGWGGVFAALVPAFFAFGGWQHALWIAGEVREPRRTLPRAIITGVLVVIAVYLLANWAFLKLLGHAGVAASQTVASDAAAKVLGEGGRRVIAAAVTVSALGVLNAQLLSGPRLVYGMARDGRFFSTFARLSPRFGTPVASILLMAGIALTLLLAVGYEGVDRLAAGAVFIDGIFFGLTGLALVVLRRRGRRSGIAPRADSYRAPFYPWVPLLFVAGELSLLAGAYIDPKARAVSIVGLAWIAGAAIVYALFFRTTVGRPDPSAAPRRNT